MIMYTDITVGCYDFSDHQRVWLRSDERKAEKVSFLARLQNWDTAVTRAQRRAAAAAV